MIVELVKQTFRDERGYKIVKKDWCCDRLKDNPLIDLYDEYMQFDNNDAPQMAIHETVHPVYEDQFDEDFYYPITVCPFCGKKIEIKVVRTEDVTNEYDTLNEQFKNIGKKMRTTDSKRKEVEFRHLYRDLDKKLSKFYILDDYEESDEKTNSRE
jgi:hypothetical protein